jgi:hypothetical protein
LLLLLALGTMAMTAMSGCNSSNGYFGQAPKSYTVTATATATSPAGTITRSTNLTLTVQ